MSNPIISTSGTNLEIQIPAGTKTITMEFSGSEATLDNLRKVEFIPAHSDSFDQGTVTIWEEKPSDNGEKS